jgi:hypothetical protein
MSRLSELVKRAAVARFLGVEPEQVQEMLELDGLPYVSIPGKKRPGVRIFLPAFHEWMVKRAKGPAGTLGDYAEFRRAFVEAQGCVIGDQ